jgi:hypothetical protein
VDGADSADSISISIWHRSIDPERVGRDNRQRPINSLPITVTRSSTESLKDGRPDAHLRIRWKSIAISDFLGHPDLEDKSLTLNMSHFHCSIIFRVHRKHDRLP